MPRLADLLGFIKNKNKFDKITLFKWLISLGGSSLVANAKYFCLEDLNVKGMMSNHRLAKSISDVSFYEFKRQLEYKSSYNDK
ncbi:hypothetical protein ACRI8K_001696, partial [Campylobacter coli]